MIEKHDQNSELLETSQTFQEMDLSQDEVGSLMCTNKFAGWIRIISEIKKSNHPQITCGDNKVAKHGHWF